MTEDLVALEARVRAAVERAKTGPKSTRKRRPTPPATKTVMNRHVKMLCDASVANFKDVDDTMRELLSDGVYSDEGFDSLVFALRSSQEAFSMYSLAAKSIVDDLKRERDELRAELGNENTKRAHRREAAGLVSAGAVTLRLVAGDFVKAGVRDATQQWTVTREEKRWSCDCHTPGECAHLRAVQLLAYKSVAVPPTSLAPDGQSLAAAGAVWVRSNERQSALAEVQDAGKTFTVARQGFGGYSCTCGSMNAKCRHGDAVRFVVAS